MIGSNCKYLCCLLPVCLLSNLCDSCLLWDMIALSTLMLVACDKPFPSHAPSCLILVFHIDKSSLYCSDIY